MNANLTSQDSGNRSHEENRAPRYLRQFFLARLRHLVALRQEQGSQLEPGTPELRLLDKAVYSTFCDCLDLGVEAKARAIIRHKEIEPLSLEAPEVDSN